jgi:uncharacterized protein (TIGR02246 family)
MVRMIALFVGSALLTGCQDVSRESKRALAADSAAIRRVLEQADAAVSAENADGYVALLATDAVLMPPNEPPIFGKEAIRSWNQAQFQQITIDVTSVPEEQVIAGDWAFHRGTARFHVMPRTGGPAFQDTGKFVIIYHRDSEGRWKIARDIWSTNSRPPSPQ